MPIAYSYIRFSTTEQRKGDSLRRQTELSEKYAALHDLTIDTSLHLYDLGVSAFDRSNVDRGALGGFLEAITQGRITRGSYLLVESLDRLSRDQVLSALKIFTSILDQGITIVTLADNMVYSAETIADNFTGLIVSITIMARAHEESATKSRRLKATWKNKRANVATKKLTAQCPRWMQLNEAKTDFELVPARVELVMEILGLVKNGMGQAQIAKRLNERKVPPFSNHGKGWHSSYIQKIVTGTALYGELQPHVWEGGKNVLHGDPVPDYYPPLISKEEFFLLQSLRSQRLMTGAKAKKGTTVPNLLSGIVKCGYCGSTMVLAGGSASRIRAIDGTSTIRPGKKVLVCDGARRGMNCYAVQWGYKDFEKSFLTFCRGLDLDRIVNIANKAENSRERQLTIQDQLHSTIAAIDGNKKQTENLVTVAGRENPPPSIVQKIRQNDIDLAALEDLKKQYESELHASEASTRHQADEVESMRESVDKMDSLSGDALFTVRVALADHIRNLIEVVKVFPAGRLTSAADIERQRTSLLESGLPTDRVDAYIQDTCRSAPERQGRGIRGRYASRKDIGRHFLIQAKNGGFRVLYPDFDDPSSVKVELEAVGSR